MINSVEDFRLMRDRVSDNLDPLGKYYKLGADLDLTSESYWYGMYIFGGYFDGQGHTIKVNSSSALFGTTSGDILNLNVTGTVRGSYEAAGIISFMGGGTLENCTFEGTIEQTYSLDSSDRTVYFTGGLVGVAGGVIKNCTFSGTVSHYCQDLGGREYPNEKRIGAGGIAGAVGNTTINDDFHSTGSIENCRVLAGSSINSTSISNNYGVAGGIAAQASATSIINCTSEADVNAETWAGGIVGMAERDVILSGNTWPSQYQEVGTFMGDYSTDSNDVEVASIAPIELDDDVISQLASNIGVDPSEIRLLTSEDIVPGIPPDPTEEMQQEAARQNYQFAAKFNTINVSEDGYYVFQVTVPDELVGLSVSSLKIMFGEESDYYSRNIEISRGIKGVRDISKIKDFKHSVRPAFFMELINGATGAFELTNFLGIELDTLPKQFLATMFLSAGESLTVYLLKTILQLLLAVCNIGIASGGVILVGGLILIKFFRRKR